VDKLLRDGEEYLKRVKKLFKQIEKRKEKDDIVGVYETIVTIIRDTLRLEGIESAKDEEIVAKFEGELVHQGKVPAKFMRILTEIMKAKKDYDSGRLTKTEVSKVKKDYREFVKFLVEYMQRKRGKEIERTKIRVKHGKRFGEVLLLDRVAFIIHDIDHEEKEISKANIKPNGSLDTITKSSLEELEHALAKMEIPPKVFIKEPIFENLKNIFGRDVEIMVNY
jgi:hypothetical protein